ncbi:HD domain-containing protein [bacterium]|nr:HD domain-containing protein [bacterium]
MTTEGQNNPPEVSVQELKTGMLITAYTRFEEKYAPLDEETCAWVKHNFSGASVRGQRNGVPFLFMAANLQPGDHILEVLHMPRSLSHICVVNNGLIKELKARGFLRFRVQVPAAASPEKSAARTAAVAKASHLLETMKQSIRLCENATTAVKSLMDSDSETAPNFQEVKQYVDQMSDDEMIQAVSAIISLKENDHVYAHCVDVGVIFQQVYFAIMDKRGDQSAFKNHQEAMLAAFLHDIGKARISKETITSTKAFKRDGPEMQEIRKHPQIGAKLLAEAGMPDVMVNMAHFHHVKRDESMNSSYPEGVKQSEILFETRLLALVDVYQALISGRSYKKSWTPPAVMRYLDAMAGVEFDLDLWDAFQAVMGYYPVGSLVKLSDHSLAFVISVPQKDILRPQVIVVVDAEGQRTEENRFIDLKEDLSLSIQKDMDSFDVFKSDALHVFTSLNVV